MQMDLHDQMYKKRCNPKELSKKTGIANEERIRTDAGVQQENAEDNTR